MIDFAEVGRDNAIPEVRRALIVKEAIELFKVFLTSSGNEQTRFVECFVNVKEDMDLPENASAPQGVFVHKSKPVNLIELYADWIEEALKIKDNA